MSAPLVKVCGVTNLADALAAVEAGADYLGLNFHPRSSRFLELDQARPIAAALAGRVELVGLFVDRPLDEVAAILAALPQIGTIQLHGHEEHSYLAACRELPTRPRIIWATRLRTPGDVQIFQGELATAAALGAAPDAILVDAFVPGQMGGTGHSIPDDLLDHLPRHTRLILAGGLTPDNVADRVRRVRPWMVDVASGVESAPGRKDPALVAAFCRAARAGIDHEPGIGTIRPLGC